MLRDAIRGRENFRATPLISSQHNSKETTSLQPPQVGGENNEICGRRAFNNNNSELLVDTRSVIIKASYVSAALPSFLLKG